MATILRRATRALGLLCLAGLAGVALVGVPQMLIPAAVLAGLAGVVAYVVTGPTTAPTAAQRATTRTLCWRVGGALGLVTLAVSGMAVLLGDATGPLLLFAALAVTAWSWSRVRPALAWIRTRRGGGVAPAREQGPVVTAPRHHEAALSTFGTAALCATWQRTYHHLADVTDAAARDALLDLRRRCLDEFERRDPVGTARWLASEPRPAGTSPLRHLHPDRPLPPAPPV